MSEDQKQYGIYVPNGVGELLSSMRLAPQLDIIKNGVVVVVMAAAMFSGEGSAVSQVVSVEKTVED